MGQEMDAWKQHISILRRDYDEYTHYNSGYSSLQKQKFSNQRVRLIGLIKHDILDYPPFAEIAYNVCNSNFCFNECYDNMDGDMERTINEIFNKQIED